MSPRFLLRAMEVYLRGLGEFDAADYARQVADAIERGYPILDCFAPRASTWRRGLS